MANRTRRALWVLAGITGCGLVVATFHALDLWDELGEAIDAMREAIRDADKLEADEADEADKADDEADDEADDDEGGE